MIGDSIMLSALRCEYESMVKKEKWKCCMRLFAIIECQNSE